MIQPHIGYYLAGLIDGEGCFFICTDRTFSCSLHVHLRADDRALLEWLRDSTGLGRLYQGRKVKRGGDQPSMFWRVTRRHETLGVVEIFNRYPLRSKKARDFKIWAEAVVAWRAQDWQQMAQLSALLRETRRFEAAGDEFEIPDSDQLALAVSP